MSHQQLAVAVPTAQQQREPVLPPLTCSRRTALNRVVEAFEASQPLTVLIGEGHCSTSFLIGRFLAGLERDVTVVRLTAPYTDEISVMRSVIQSIGFDSYELSLTDLENVLTMFLSFQKTHQNRTVLCLEETQECGSWLIDRIGCLVQLETDNELGLMILAAGRAGLGELLNGSHTTASVADAKQRIALAPFTLAETRDYIRLRIESSDDREIADVFEFDAITRVHELSEGAADMVNDLCSSCLELARRTCTAPVTTGMVSTAETLLRSASVTRQAITNVEAQQESKECSQIRHLTICVNKKLLKKLCPNRGNILIGRDRHCDIHLPNPSVSRHHAMIVNTPSGIAIVDLASTNGTFVDGNSVKHCELASGGDITIGDCTMAYGTDDERRDWCLDINRPNIVATHNRKDATQSLKQDLETPE